MSLIKSKHHAQNYTRALALCSKMLVEFWAKKDKTGANILFNVLLLNNNNALEIGMFSYGATTAKCQQSLQFGSWQMETVWRARHNVK